MPKKKPTLKPVEYDPNFNIKMCAKCGGHGMMRDTRMNPPNLGFKLEYNEANDELIVSCYRCGYAYRMVTHDSVGVNS